MTIIKTKTAEGDLCHMLMAVLNCGGVFFIYRKESSIYGILT